MKTRLSASSPAAAVPAAVLNKKASSIRSDRIPASSGGRAQGSYPRRGLQGGVTAVKDLRIVVPGGQAAPMGLRDTP
ncbi:hypothetical protein GCM10027159_15690 [Lysobacter terrae]